jgi:hypothetical protein
MSKHVECKCKGKIHPRTGQAQRGSRGTAPLVHESRFTPAKDPVSILLGGWMGIGAGLKGAVNLAPIGIRSPDRSARSE